MHQNLTDLNDSKQKFQPPIHGKEVQGRGVDVTGQFHPELFGDRKAYYTIGVAKDDKFIGYNTKGFPRYQRPDNSIYTRYPTNYNPSKGGSPVYLQLMNSYDSVLDMFKANIDDVDALYIDPEKVNRLNSEATISTYIAKDKNGMPLRDTTGKFITGSSEHEARMNAFRLGLGNSQWSQDVSYGQNGNLSGTMQPDMETFNGITGGFFNRLSPTQNARLVWDTATGKNPTSWFGNNGIVSDKFAEEHPYLAMTANLVGDVALGGGMKLLPKSRTNTSVPSSTSTPVLAPKPKPAPTSKPGSNFNYTSAPQFTSPTTSSSFSTSRFSSPSNASLVTKPQALKTFFSVDASPTSTDSATNTPKLFSSPETTPPSLYLNDKNELMYMWRDANGHIHYPSQLMSLLEIINHRAPGTPNSLQYNSLGRKVRNLSETNNFQNVDPYYTYYGNVPQSAMNEFKHSIFGRNLRLMQEVGENPYSLDLYVNRFTPRLQSVMVGIHPYQMFKNAGMSNASGLFTKTKVLPNGSIALRSGRTPYQMDTTMLHELRHALLSYDDYIQKAYPKFYKKQLDYLDAAYGKEFNDAFIEIDPSYADDIANELVTSNINIRRDLLNLNDLLNASIDDQNLYIDNVSTENLIEVMKNGPGYTEEFVNYLLKHDLLTPERVLAIKNALKYVGAVTPVGVGATLVDSNKSNTNNLAQ